MSEEEALPIEEIQPYTRDMIDLEIDAATESGEVPNVSDTMMVRVGPEGKLQIYRSLNLFGVYANRTCWPGLDLSESTFQDATLADALIMDSQLQQSTFERAWMPRIRIERTDMSKVNFKRTHMNNAIIRQSLLDGAQCSSAEFHNASFEEVFATGASFPRARFIDASCIKMVIIDGDMKGANCTGIDLTGADLSQTDCTYTNFTHACLVGTRLDQTVLSWATLTGVLFGEDIQDAEDMLRRADLHHIKANVFWMCRLVEDRAHVRSYRDQLTILGDTRRLAPDIFEALGVLRPLDIPDSMKQPPLKRLIAVARFADAMLPFVDEEGEIHPLWTPVPVRNILIGWLSEWLAGPLPSPVLVGSI